MFAIARVVEEYKKSKDFENDATEVRTDAYAFCFINCKNMVT